MSSIDEPKYCRDCQFFVSMSFLGPLCNGGNPEIDLATGVSEWDRAETYRKNERMCGSQGKWFKKRKEISPHHTPWYKESFLLGGKLIWVEINNEP